MCLTDTSPYFVFLCTCSLPVGYIIYLLSQQPGYYFKSMLRFIQFAWQIAEPLRYINVHGRSYKLFCVLTSSTNVKTSTSPMQIGCVTAIAAELATGTTVAQQVSSAPLLVAGVHYPHALRSFWHCSVSDWKLLSTFALIIDHSSRMVQLYEY